MCYLVPVVMVIGLLGAKVHAEPAQPQSALMLREVVIGSIVALGGGISGVMAGAYMGQPAVEQCARKQPSCQDELFCFRFNLCSLTGLPYMIWGYVIGVPLGATLGVSLVGHLNGISGNFWLAAAGAIVGETLGISASIALANLLQTEWPIAMWISTLTAIPVSSALGATIGFNLGARYHEPTPWSLPFVAWRF